MHVLCYTQYMHVLSNATVQIHHDQGTHGLPTPWESETGALNSFPAQTPCAIFTEKGKSPIHKPILTPSGFWALSIWQWPEYSKAVWSSLGRSLATTGGTSLVEVSGLWWAAEKPNSQGSFWIMAEDLMFKNVHLSMLFHCILDNVTCDIRITFLTLQT